MAWTRSPRAAASLYATASSWSSGKAATRSSGGGPTASSAGYPNSRSAAGFHETIFDSRSVTMIAVGLISSSDSK